MLKRFVSNTLQARDRLIPVRNEISANIKQFGAEMAIKSLPVKLGLNLERIQDNVDAPIDLLPPPQIKKEDLEAKWKELREIQFEIQDVRKELGTIHDSIISNRFQAPDQGFIIKMKRKVELEEREKVLLQNQNEMFQEIEDYSKIPLASSNNSRKVTYSLLGLGLGLGGFIYKAYCDQHQLKKMDDILETVRTFNMQESGGLGVTSAIKSTGNTVYGWGASAGKTAYGWGATAGKTAYGWGATAGKSAYDCGAWTVKKLKFW